MRSFTLQLLLITAVLPLVLGACSSKEPLDPFQGVADQGRHPGTKPQTIEGVDYQPQELAFAEAREIKLKARELAEQLVADMRDCSLQGVVALPTSFVNLNDFNETSAFGRLMGEQMFYELNQRGYPVREYRTNGSIQPSKRAGEFVLSRELGRVSAKGGVIVLGTYSQAENGVFVNARLVRPGDGRVLRTANVLFEGNPTVVGLLSQKSRNLYAFGGKGGRGGRGGASGSGGDCMTIRDFDRTVRPAPARRNLTPFDVGQDIH